MAEHLFSGAEIYRRDVMTAVIDAVIRAGGADREVAGVVKFPAALEGICDAIVMLVAAAGVDRSPKQRRDTADLCRRRILTSSGEVARRIAAGEELPWTMPAITSVDDS